MGGGWFDVCMEMGVWNAIRLSLIRDDVEVISLYLVAKNATLGYAVCGCVRGMIGRCKLFLLLDGERGKR